MKNFEEDLKVLDLSNDSLAQEVYAALCNQAWYETNNPVNIFSCSWRYAAHLISDIRNSKYGKKENYMDYYCSGIVNGVREGDITDRVNIMFKDLGWTQHMTYYSDVE